MMKPRYQHSLFRIIVLVLTISLTACNLERASSPISTTADVRKTADSTPTPPTESSIQCGLPLGWTLYTVQPGDTLESLAQSYNATIEVLIHANCLATQELIPGTRFYVPGPPAAESPIQCGAPSDWIFYTVQPGDTLLSIAQTYGVTIAELQVANCLGSSTLIRAGQRVFVPNVRIPTPTPTTVLVLGESDVPPVETTLPPSTNGEIELRFTDPMSQEECEAHFLFDIVDEAGLRKIEGSGILDCHRQIEQCGDGVCLMYHSKYYMDAGVSGVIHDSSTDFPDGFLEASLAGTFTMTQYWSDYPPETVVLFTEEHPSVFSGSDIIPLNFNFTEGATEEVNNQAGQFPWVFTLHLY
jgi:LysM repeat protein